MAVLTLDLWQVIATFVSIWQSYGLDMKRNTQVLLAYAAFFESGHKNLKQCEL